MLRPAYGFQRLAEMRQLRVHPPGRHLRHRRTARGFSNRLELDELGLHPGPRRPGRALGGGVGRRPARLRRSRRAARCMLLLSGGWPFSPADYVLNAPGTAGPDPGGAARRGPAPAARGHRQPARLHDLRGRRAGRGFAGAGRFRGGAAHGRARTCASRRSTHRSSTWPGRPAASALLNARRAEALETAEADTRSYYWLGFTPSPAAQRRAARGAGRGGPPPGLEVALARQLPRPGAQDRGLDDGRERHALRQPAGRRGHARRDRQARARPAAGRWWCRSRSPSR